MKVLSIGARLPIWNAAGISPADACLRATIMTLKRRAAFSAAALLGLAAFVTFSAAPAKADGAQFCIARGGSNGDSSYVGNCVYSDYQQCIQAAAEQRGNCVQNVEYHGGEAAAPRTMRTRRAR